MSWAGKLFSPAVAGCAWVPRRRATSTGTYRWLRLAGRVASCCAYGGVIYQEVTVHAIELIGWVFGRWNPPSSLRVLGGLHLEYWRVGAPRRRRTVTV